MPLYQYYCEKCGRSFEVFQYVKDRDHPTLQGCSSCQGPIKRAVSDCSFRLGKKGAVGWASNGYGDNTLGNDPDWRKANKLS